MPGNGEPYGTDGTGIPCGFGERDSRWSEVHGRKGDWMSLVFLIVLFLQACGFCWLGFFCFLSGFGNKANQPTIANQPSE